VSYHHFPAPPKPISDGQVRMLYALARKAGMDNDLLHAKVKALTGGCEHISHLTSLQGILIIERLQQEAGETPKPKAVPNDRATIAQRNLIRVLACELGWDAEGTRLRAFLEKCFGVSDVQFLTAAKTSSVIEAMKAMKQGGRGERRPNDG
jgi:hypothetical protein